MLITFHEFIHFAAANGSISNIHLVFSPFLRIIQSNLEHDLDPIQYVILITAYKLNKRLYTQ